PFSFVTISGTAETTDDPAELLRWATRIGGRYMGADRAEEFGRRNAVPPEMVVRVTAAKIVTEAAVVGELIRGLASAPVARESPQLQVGSSGQASGEDGCRGFRYVLLVGAAGIGVPESYSADPCGAAEGDGHRAQN